MTIHTIANQITKKTEPLDNFLINSTHRINMELLEALGAVTTHKQEGLSHCRLGCIADHTHIHTWLAARATLRWKRR
jgi:hypothetical protein